MALKDYLPKSLSGKVAEVKPTAVSKAAPRPIGTLESRVAELEGDLARLVQLLAKQYGGIFAKEASDIVGKKQG